MRSDGLRLAAYGAATKGTILLDCRGIDAAACELVADRNPAEQGQRMPGIGIGTLGPDALLVPGAVR